MRKLLLVACLALGTFAWAQSNVGADQQRNQPGYGQQGTSQQGMSSQQGISSQQGEQQLNNQQELNSQQEQFNNQQPGNLGAMNRTGVDWYQAKLDPQIADWAQINGAVAPSELAADQQQNTLLEQPNAMAANPEFQGQDWYQAKLNVSVQRNARDLNMIKSAQSFKQQYQPREAFREETH